MKTFPILHDMRGRALLNLACGARTAPGWNNLDFSPYARLRKHPLLASALYAVGILSNERMRKLEAIDPGILHWNLARGVPFPDESFDVVYHSHFLEHLPRQGAKLFLIECWRVLKPGGILRVVVPDLELLVREYWDALNVSEDAHDAAIAGLIDQMVRTESSGTAEQKPWVRRIERLLRGDAAKTGELHRWMYDVYSLARLLSDVGFGTLKQCESRTSWMEDWADFNLDTSVSGWVYKPKSLYLEGRK